MGSKLLNSRGFSLFELIIVMVIIGLGSALVVPRIGGSLESLEVRAAARKVVSAMRYARNIAVYNSCACQIVIDINSGSMTVEKISYNSGGAGLTTFRIEQMQQLKFDHEIGLNVEKYAGIETGNGIYQFIFFPSGALRGGDVIVHGKNKTSERISADVVTGLPRIEG